MGDVLAAATGRIERIDGLRGWAALCVCVQHALHPIVVHPATPPDARALLSAATLDRFDLGRYGVVLFFLISGYVIPFSLRGADALPRFAVTRALRLYPAFWLSLAAMLLITAPLPDVARVAANLTMAPTLFGHAPLSGVYWTLFVELAFYALSAALFAVGLLRRPGAVFAVGLACVTLPLMGVLLRELGMAVPILYLGAHLSILFAGTLMRLARERCNRATRVFAIALTLAALAAMPVLAAQPDGSFTRSSASGVLLAAAAALATFAVLHDRPGSVSPALLRLGALSYSVYLFHVPVLRVMERIIPPATMPAAILFLVLTLAATLALAAVVHDRIERPMIAWGRRLGRRPADTIALAP